MKKRISYLLQNVAFYPFVLSIFPVMFLYAYNFGKTSFSETLLVFDLSLVLVGLFYLFFIFVYWNSEKAAFVSSLWVLLITSFGNFLDMVFPPEIVDTSTYTYTFAAWLVLMLGAVFVVKRIKFDFSKITYALNIFSLSLTLIPVFNIFTTLNISLDKRSVSSKNEIVFSEVKTKSRPDVYYFIFDRYASLDTLTKIYGYDNSKFYHDLRSEGFYVAEKSSANYLKTAHSLASSLNMTYLDDLVSIHSPKDRSWYDIYYRLKDYNLWHFFKNLGYKFVYFGSWWEPTGRNPNANLNINFYSTAEFGNVYYKITLIYHLVELLYKNNTALGLWQSGNETLAKLTEIPIDPASTFTVAHVLIPHPPYVFEADGSVVETPSQSEEDAYIKQVKFINKKIIELSDFIIKSNPDSIIVVQSDEGPHPRRYNLVGPMFDWRTSTDVEINQKMQILDAYYFPDQNYASLYQTITPVNSFRLILNTYFDQDLPLLEDKNYVFTDNNHPFDITEVTSRIQR